jgi:glutathione S-transferase
MTFAASHFCEKARWALDWHGIAYDEIGWPPGLHVVLAKRCGANGTTLPIVLDGSEVIQGSGAIIDWVDGKAKDPRRSLTPKAALAEVKEIERRVDQVIGVHVRRPLCRDAATLCQCHKAGTPLSLSRVAPTCGPRYVADRLAYHDAKIRGRA